MKKSFLIKAINFWPPFIGTGIRLTRTTDDFREIDVEMTLRFWNKNYVNVHFGGSMYAMVDPFYMLMLLENLGPKYVVWDKAATIRFKKPGRGRVRASFKLTEDDVTRIKLQADLQEKVEPQFTVQILNDDNEVVAVVDKLLYVKRKDKIKSR